MKKPIAAILYDFDSTLAKSDMQNFGFIPALGLSPAEFWSATTRFAEESGVERTLSYLYMMVKMTKERGIKMTREWLRDMGRKIEFFPGVHTWFKRINDFGKEHGVSVEHYLISSGNMEILEGCDIAKEFKKIYACEFLFDPVSKEPVWPKLAINFTQKTQYFFRISKGVYDANDDAGVNEKRPDRRIPYTNIIYIGDGMTDIPAMIIAKNRIRAAGCILPVAQTANLPKEMGLRHRSGLGMSFETDALVIIVSEERGKISVAHNVNLSVNISGEELQQILCGERQVTNYC